MARYGRVTFSISYVVDLDDAEMVDDAREYVAQDVADTLRHCDTEHWISVEPDPTATENDIEECLLQLREHRLSK